jgi:peptidoglycan biosynthesis protein MviN/MurJ (putative lipid II flippase)
MMVLIFIPLAAIIIILRYPIVLGLFGGAKFNHASAELTTGPLQLYAAGMLIGALEIIVLQFFFAMSDTLRPTIIGMAMVPLHICIAYAGIRFWGLEAMSIALALQVSKGAKVAFLYVMMRRKVQSLEGRRTLILLGKVLVSLLPLIAILLLALHFLHEPDIITGKTKIKLLLGSAVGGGVGFASYLAVLYLMRTEEVSVLTERVLGKLRKKSAAEPEVPQPAGD